MPKKEKSVVSLGKKNIYITFLVLAGYQSFIYSFLELLFLTTKPSFVQMMPIQSKVNAFLFGFALLFLFQVALFLSFKILLILLSGFPSISTKNIADYLTIRLGGAVLGFISAILALLLFDNFTYTLFGVGIVNASKGFLLLLYLVGFAVAFVSSSLKWSSVIPKIGDGNQMNRSILYIPFFAFLLFVASFTTKFAFLNETTMSASKEWSTGQNAQKLPNIVIFGSDGVEAESMSFYNYQVKTTPELDKLRNKALVFENAFSNAVQTTGSVISMLTGKEPLKTKVLYRPHLLKGIDTYQHLPGILKRLGYRTIQIAPPYYADSYELDLIDGFDFVNGKTVDDLAKDVPIRLREEYLFVRQLINRPKERILHLLGMKKMSDPYKIVTKQTIQGFSDKDRLKMISDTITEYRKSDHPFFAHVHMLDTHHNHPTQEEYNQSIKHADSLFHKFYQFLEKNEIIDNTLIIYYSDHGISHNQNHRGAKARNDQKINKRIPLVFLFPGSFTTGTRKKNSQLLDIAPTILDYLGERIPDWMDGTSLLDEQRPNRRIFTLGRMRKGSSPPLYGLQHYLLTTCQKQFRLTIFHMTMSEADIKGHTSPCPKETLIDGKTAKKEILAHLKRYKIQY